MGKKKYKVADFPGGPVLRCCTPNAGRMGVIPGWITKIMHGMAKKNIKLTKLALSLTSSASGQLSNI